MLLVAPAHVRVPRARALVRRWCDVVWFNWLTIKYKLLLAAFSGETRTFTTTQHMEERSIGTTQHVKKRPIGTTQHVVKRSIATIPPKKGSKGAKGKKTRLPPTERT